MNFYALAKTNELCEGFVRSIKVGDINVFITYVEGDVYILEDRCPHMDMPLSTGAVENGAVIRCAAHGVAFNLESGAPCEGMWVNTLPCVRRFEPVYRDYIVGIEIDEETPSEL